MQCGFLNSFGRLRLFALFNTTLRYECYLNGVGGYVASPSKQCAQNMNGSSMPDSSCRRLR